MKKILSLMFVAMLVFMAQSPFVDAAKKGKPAEPIKQSQVYPKDIAKDLNYNGTVMVKAVVDENGKVIKTEIMRSSGRTKVDKAAMEAASKWEFKPAVDENGNPVENWYMIKFEAKDF